MDHKLKVRASSVSSEIGYCVTLEDYFGSKIRKYMLLIQYYRKFIHGVMQMITNFVRYV